MNAPQPAPVHRFEVRPAPGRPDPRAHAAAAKANSLGFPVRASRSAKVYLIEASLSDAQLHALANRLLADPVVEVARRGTADLPAPSVGATIEVHPLPGVMDPAAQSVMQAVRELTGMIAQVSTGVRYDLEGLSGEQAAALARAALANPVVHQIVQGTWTPSELPKGHAYQFKKITVPIRSLSDEQLMKLSKDGHLFLNLAEMKAIQGEFVRLGREPSDIELETIAQTWSEHCVHKTLKATVRYNEGGGGSERASERTSERGVRIEGRPGHVVHSDGSVTIHNLLKSTIAAATHELIAEGVDWTLSVFKDNSGVIAFDDQWGVCIKVETHNRPSAIEPYGGAATGIGGCIRDVIGTGLGAKPIASTDVFCVADPQRWNTKDAKDAKSAENAAKPTAQPTSAASTSPPIFEPFAPFALHTLPPGVLHPRRILQDVVAGVRDYGNRMGIPTVSGGVFFDDRYVGNPLVYCGCIGLIPRHLVNGKPRKGDRIIAIGGRTGRDGIHGATFSSGELQSTSASEFAHAVQIGNAIEEKRVLDALMRARDWRGENAERGEAAITRDTSRSPLSALRSPLYTAMTDCGAGGFSSAVGEMGSRLGARVTLETAPLKYAGLSYTEVWISEAQERMVLAVPPANVPALRRICEEEGVELADLGEFGTDDGELVLMFQGHEVGRLSMHFLHEGLPNPTREAAWTGGASERRSASLTSPPAHLPTPSSPSSLPRSLASSLPALLSHPTIASKHWIIRQYDHEVQGNTVIKPLLGPLTRGPSDASVIQPVEDSPRGLAISQGLQTPVGDVSLGGDPYWMAMASIDECVRNLVCVGADPSRIAILDNFCWASCEKPENLGALVRACWGGYDGAKAYRTPFVSGKDSLSNQLRYVDPATGEQKLIEVPPTLLITGMGIVPDVARCVTMDAKQPGRALLVISGADPATANCLGASLFAQHMGAEPHADLRIPRVSLTGGPDAAKAIHALMQAGLVHSAHDCSEGGLLVAIAEMLIAGSSPAQPIGAAISLSHGPASGTTLQAACFGEAPSRYVIEVDADQRTLERIGATLSRFASVSCMQVGVLNASGRLTLAHRGGTEAWEVEALASAWRRTLDW